MEPLSPAVVSIDPNPVRAHSEAILTIFNDGLPSGATVGANSEWQCWDGSVWKATHQVVRGFDSVEPQTIALTPGESTTIPAIEFVLINGLPVVIPDVAPGTYRLAVPITLTEGEDIIGFVHVLVVE